MVILGYVTMVIRNRVIVAKINVPANAMAYGDTWICNNGYKKQGNSCKKINVPANHGYMVILGYVTMVIKNRVIVAKDKCSKR